MRKLDETLIIQIGHLNFIYIYEQPNYRLEDNAEHYLPASLRPIVNIKIII